jgi:hypothetical protein
MTTSRADLAQRQVDEMWARYRVNAWAIDDKVFVTAPEWASLWVSVWADDRLNAIGRGFYLNGNRNVVVVPVCDRCGLELYMHGDTLAGQACDLNAAFDDLWRSLLGRFWWKGYNRAAVR